MLYHADDHLIITEKFIQKGLKFIEYSDAINIYKTQWSILVQKPREISIISSKTMRETKFTNTKDVIIRTDGEALLIYYIDSAKNIIAIESFRPNETFHKFDVLYPYYNKQLVEIKGFDDESLYDPQIKLSKYTITQGFSDLDVLIHDDS